MNFDRPMSDRYAELVSLGLIQPSSQSFIGDFRLPTARVYVPLVTDYSTMDTKYTTAEGGDAKLGRYTEGDSGNSA